MSHLPAAACLQHLDGLSATHHPQTHIKVCVCKHKLMGSSPLVLTICCEAGRALKTVIARIYTGLVLKG